MLVLTTVLKHAENCHEAQDKSRQQNKANTTTTTTTTATNKQTRLIAFNAG